MHYRKISSVTLANTSIYKICIYQFMPIFVLSKRCSDTLASRTARSLYSLLRPCRDGSSTRNKRTALSSSPRGQKIKGAGLQYLSAATQASQLEVSRFKLKQPNDKAMAQVPKIMPRSTCCAEQKSKNPTRHAAVQRV